MLKLKITEDSFDNTIDKSLNKIKTKLQNGHRWCRRLIIVYFVEIVICKETSHYCNLAVCHLKLTKKGVCVMLQYRD